MCSASCRISSTLSSPCPRALNAAAVCNEYLATRLDQNGGKARTCGWRPH
jgi:hypothetical protein